MDRPNFNSNPLPCEYLEEEETYLSQISQKDNKWDYFKYANERVGLLYQGTVYDKYHGRMQDCSGYLMFVIVTNLITGIQELRLRSARFCRVPRCPTCQWRRAVMWRARVFRILPGLREDYPKAGFILLTLTVRNCLLSDLRATLVWMNKSWQRLTQREQFPAIGYFKAVEVTRGKDDYVHPHFHCLLMVPSTYFGREYIKQEEWANLWKDCLKTEYMPVVDVRSLKIHNKTEDQIRKGILETLKYGLKPQDLIGKGKISDLESDKKWLVELTQQLYKVKMCSVGGVLKKYLQILEEEPEDLIHVDDGLTMKIDQEDVTFLYCKWLEHKQRYVVNSIHVREAASSVEIKLDASSVEIKLDNS